jgi:hypothetical protein
MNLSVGHCRGTSMSLCVTANGEEIYKADSIQETTIMIEHSAMLPLSLIFDVGNKSDSDTVIDSNGKILEDKFIQVDRLLLDGLDIKPWVLQSRVFEFESLNSVTKTNCFAYNGQASMTIKQTDLLEYFLELMVKNDY